MDNPIEQFLDMPLPAFVLSDAPHWISGAIKQHQQGFYSHIMIAYRTDRETGEVVLLSQDFPLLGERLLGEFLHSTRLKIWHNPSWIKDRTDALRLHCYKMINLPWYKRLYDFLGIYGQLRNKVRINIPWLNYCSELAGKGLKIVEPEFQEKHPSPTDINFWCKQHEQMKVWGTWEPDRQRLDKD